MNVKRIRTNGDHLSPIKKKTIHSEMTIDQLPVEMLTRIFSFLPTFYNVSLVNKLFYSVACKVNFRNFCLRINYRFWEREELLQGVINSTRHITRVDIDLFGPYEPAPIQIRKIISIVKKFSTSIKYLRNKAYLNLAEFIEMLSLVPNLEELAFHSFLLLGNNTASPREMSSNDDLNLHQLKKLNSSCHSPSFWVVLNRLPVGVLQELELQEVDSLSAATVLFKRQTNIKKLKLMVYKVDDDGTAIADIFDNLKLESLEFRYIRYKKFNVAPILSKQTKLKSLTLHNVMVDRNFLNFVSNQMTELETFSMNICETESPIVAHIAQISKLKWLKDLSLVFDEESKNELEPLAKQRNHALTALTLRCRGEYSEYLITALAKSMPNLKFLKITDAISTQTFNSVMKHFNFVEVLDVRTKCDIELTEPDCFNPKLTELIIGFPENLQFLDRLIADYPNLVKFQTVNGSAISSTQFRRLLVGFTKLESLKLYGCASLTLDDLKYLIDHKKNLKFVTLDGLEYGPSDDLKRLFRAAFRPHHERDVPNTPCNLW